MPEQYRRRLPLTPNLKYLTKDEAAMTNPIEAFKAIAGRMEARRKKAHDAYTKQLRDIAAEEDNTFRELQSHTQEVAEAAARAKESGARRRQPLDPGPQGWRLPPNVASADLEARIDLICGCNGKYDCDCVSVFNQASRELWTEHNTGEPYSVHQRRLDTTDA